MKLERPILIVMSLSLLCIETIWSTCLNSPGYCEPYNARDKNDECDHYPGNSPHMRRKRAAKPPLKLSGLDSSETVGDELSGDERFGPKSCYCSCCFAGPCVGGCSPSRGCLTVKEILKRKKLS